MGSPKDFAGADNAGVGPGLAFAQTIVAARGPRLACYWFHAPSAEHPSPNGVRVSDFMMKRFECELALEQGPSGKTRIAGALWLQGEADSSSAERVASYRDSLARLIDDLRADLGIPDLPFIACTIGEMRSDIDARQEMNAILLDPPKQRSYTACVDGRSFATSIGDNVHFDTPTQEEHGRRFASWFLKLTEPKYCELSPDSGDTIADEPSDRLIAASFGHLA